MIIGGKFAFLIRRSSGRLPLWDDTHLWYFIRKATPDSSAVTASQRYASCIDLQLILHDVTLTLCDIISLFTCKRACHRQCLLTSI